jgi:hypothetical protein
MMFALPVLLRGRLAIGIGIHLIQNFVYGYLFGVGGTVTGVGPSVFTIGSGNAGFWFGSTGMIRTSGIVTTMTATVLWTWWREGTLPAIQWTVLSSNTANRAE